MTEKLMGSNNPVVSFMLEAGQEAHHAYQHNSSNCTVYEWPVAGGKADCIKASSCEVIELKPNNSRSIYKGREQAERYTTALNSGGKEFEELVSKDSKFKGCKGKFRRRVACYKFCPEIDDEGQVRSTSVGWDFCE
jgi:hypothetical protein